MTDIIIDAEFEHLCPPLTPEEYAGLEDSLRMEGCRDALVVWASGNVLLDGHNRKAICERLGIPYRTVELHLPDRDAARRWVITNQLARRNLSPDAASLLRGKLYNAQKAPRGGREARGFGVAEVATPKTAERLADELGVSERTIRNDGAFAQAVEALEPYVSDITERVMAGDIPSRKDVVEAAREPETAPERLAVHYSSATPEWYTPDSIIARTVACLGAIDLDPCSNTGEPNVPAVQHYTESDDGLAQAWSGRVYMNPPYGNGISEWVEKLCAAYEGGDVPAAIALVPARTDTQWFRRFREYPRCFVWGRLRFSGHDNSAPFPSMAVYLGADLDAFIGAFGDIGDIYILA